MRFPPNCPSPACRRTGTRCQCASGRRLEFAQTVGAPRPGSRCDCAGKQTSGSKECLRERESEEEKETPLKPTEPENIGLDDSLRYYGALPPADDGSSRFYLLYHSTRMAHCQHNEITHQQYTHTRTVHSFEKLHTRRHSVYAFHCCRNTKTAPPHGLIFMQYTPQKQMMCPSCITQKWNERNNPCP